MPRLMSFSKTTEQIRKIEVVDVRREPIGALDPDEQIGISGHRPPLADVHYTPEGRQAEVVAEGFPEMNPAKFVEFFCREMGCSPDDEITRIEFEYVDDAEEGNHANC